MQQNEILNLSRENYKVPSGEEKSVHYKLAIVKNGVASNVRLVKSNVKLFSSILRNYELSGYTIEILHHPQGKYTSVTIPKPVSVIISEKDAEIARLTERIKNEGTDFILKKKDDEIEQLKKELAEKEAALKEKAKKEEKPEEKPEDGTKDETKDETPKEPEKEPTKKETKPKKEKKESKTKKS